MRCSRKLRAGKLCISTHFPDGVAADPALNQADGLHPNAKGVAIIAERMLPFVLDALEKDRK